MKPSIYGSPFYEVPFWDFATEAQEKKKCSFPRGSVKELNFLLSKNLSSNLRKLYTNYYDWRYTEGIRYENFKKISLALELRDVLKFLRSIH